MARKNRDKKAIDNTVAKSRLRSSLFHWMVKHHDYILERWDGDKIDWVTFCAELTELGLTDLTGKPASEKTGRQTWFRARVAVEKKRKARAVAPPARVNPSRVDKNWRPANAPPPTTQLVPAAAGADALKDIFSAIRKNPSDKDDGYDPKARKAALFRTIAERSGH